MSKINSNIFRAYDIRGVYPKEINPENTEMIGRAFVKFLRRRLKIKSLKIVVGRDNRLSSPVLCQALKKGILNEGGDVVDIGLSSTPMFYFAVWKYRFDGGIQVTGSHNPPKYNGFKVVGKDAEMIGESNGLTEIKEIALREKEAGKELKKGRARERNILSDYIRFNLKGVKLEKLRPHKIAIDTGNAVSGILVRELKKYLPCKIYHLFPKLDGTFPNHGLDPAEEKNLRPLQKVVKEKKLNLGIAFDGDGDRIFFVDEKGKAIPSSFIVALIAKIILRERAGEKIFYDICMSNIIKEVVKEAGGVPIVTKVGHTFIKEKMLKERPAFAGEYSGHYYLREHNFCEAPLFVIFKIIEEMSVRGEGISNLTKPFQKYFHSGRINLEIKDKKRVLELLEKKYQGGKISRLDGLRIDFKDWWFNARPSNTEDLLRVVVEAKTKSLMKEKLKEIIEILKGK